MFVYYKLAAPPAKGSVFGAYEDVTVPTEISRVLTAVAATPLKNYAVCTPNVTDKLFIQ